MRESIGNAFILNIIIVFIIVFIIIFAGSASYSKGARVRDSIIDILVQNADEIGADSTRLPDSVEQKIDDELRTIGYRVNPNGTQNCVLPNDSEVSGSSTVGSSGQDKNIAVLLTPTSHYRYCVWRIPAERGYYFKVVAYMYFDFPIISAIEYPIAGESRIIYDTVQYSY